MVKSLNEDIKESEIRKLKKSYSDALNKYLDVFCRMYGFDSQCAKWDEQYESPIVTIGEYCLSAPTVISCVNKNIPKSQFVSWYTYIIEVMQIDERLPTTSVIKFIKGENVLTDEYMGRMRIAKQRLENAETVFDRSIAESSFTNLLRHPEFEK